ncbi:hypothetical protein [Mesorhizobium sp. A623]
MEFRALETYLDAHAEAVASDAVTAAARFAAWRSAQQAAGPLAIASEQHSERCADPWPDNQTARSSNSETSKRGLAIDWLILRRYGFSPDLIYLNMVRRVSS